MRFASALVAGLVVVIGALGGTPPTSAYAGPGSVSSKAPSIANAKKSQKLLKRAVADADAAYRAEGKLEMQAFSLDDTQAWELLQQVQVISVGDAYTCGKNVESVYDLVNAGIRLYKRGSVAQARDKWDAALRRDLPRLRTWVARYRGNVLTLASDVNYAVSAVGKPWMANPAIEENIDEALAKLESRLRQAQKVAG